MEQTPKMPPYQDDEITLKELIEKIVEFWWELWKNKWKIILLSLPFILYFGFKAKTALVTYNAGLTYTLNDGSGSGGALAGILGSFGLGKGGKVNLDKIVELSKSKNIIHKVIFSKIALDTFGPQKDYIANHLIKLYELDKKWTNKKDDFTGFRFKNDSISNFTNQEFAALKMIYEQIVGSKNSKDPIFSNGFSEDTGILTLSANTVDEQLSISFSNLTYNALKDYYISTSTQSSQSTFTFVENKTDSIFSLLKSKEFQLSRFNDSHRNLSDPNMITQKRLLENEILKLKAMYGEATKNKEIADFSLAAGTPEISIIDAPLPPLDPIGPSLLIELIKGALLGGLLASGFFIASKIVRDAMQ